MTDDAVERVVTDDITILLTGNRLQITADVDADGIKKLRDVLTKHEEILQLLAAKDDEDDEAAALMARKEKSGA